MDAEFLVFVGIGFAAQLVDGALGMAFGVIATSTLIAAGAPPALASAAIHAAEIVTTGLSGASHLFHRNIDRRLFTRLLPAGLAGGVLGAYVLTGLPEGIVKPLVTVYLALMAVVIVARVVGLAVVRFRPPPFLVGLVGSFLDAFGGGWGPIVASTLLAGGDTPRRTIGTVSVTEFFVTAAVSTTFLFTLDLSNYGRVVAGLIVGGALAAPLAGYFVKIMPSRIALALVATALSGLAIFNLVGAFG
jgi:uncharacterized membrane protein YfcA